MANKTKKSKKQRLRGLSSASSSTQSFAFLDFWSILSSKFSVRCGISRINLIVSGGLNPCEDACSKQML